MKDYSDQKVITVNKPPVVLDFVDYLSCPVCDFEILVVDLVVDNGSFVSCENCEHLIKFVISRL